MDDIYIRTPVNKTAALAVSQSGCEDEASLEYKRDSLARALQHIQREMSALPKKHRYKKDLGVKKLDMQVEISRLNKEIKLKNIRDCDLNEYILTECKHSMTTQRWNEIICKARAAKEEDIRLQKIKIGDAYEVRKTRK